MRLIRTIAPLEESEFTPVATYTIVEGEVELEMQGKRWCPPAGEEVLIGSRCYPLCTESWRDGISLVLWLQTLKIIWVPGRMRRNEAE
ncbi:hypothetical protein [Kamptonema formosum]|uniref:hypothetical protein n=1 Tax=Kamptonema formosum TaxID=331992 RepID=UPI000347F39E|nr:hypothetical protein [Oscillatoria sp. PCC 10802]